MTSTHDDYDQHAREYAAGLLRKHGEFMMARFGPGQATFDLGRFTEGAWACEFADWLEAPR